MSISILFQYYQSMSQYKLRTFYLNKSLVTGFTFSVIRLNLSKIKRFLLVSCIFRNRLTPNVLVFFLKKLDTVVKNVKFVKKKSQLQGKIATIRNQFLSSIKFFHVKWRHIHFNHPEIYFPFFGFRSRFYPDKTMAKFHRKKCCKNLTYI